MPSAGSAVEVREAVAARLRRRDDLAVVRQVEGAAHDSDLDGEQPRRSLGSVERRHVGVGRRDHVAAPVAVEPHRPDRLADLEVGVGLDDALGREDGLEAADPRHPAGRQRAGLGGEEPDRERLLEARPRDLVGHRLAEREPQRDVDEVDAGRVTHEVGHLASRDPGRDLDDGDRAVRMGDQLRERDPVAKAEHLDGARRDALRELELVAVGRGGVDVDPADAEADPGRPQPVGERHHLGGAAAGDHDAVHLDAVDEALEDALLLRRLRERGVEMAVEVVLALDPEDAPLPARVGRLEHGRQPDRPRAPAVPPRASERRRTAAAERRPPRTRAASRSCCASAGRRSCRSTAARGAPSPPRRRARRGRPRPSARRRPRAGGRPR